MLVLLNDGILYFLPRELRPRAKVETPGVEGAKKDPEQGGDKSSEIFITLEVWLGHLQTISHSQKKISSQENISVIKNTCALPAVLNFNVFCPCKGKLSDCFC